MDYTPEQLATDRAYDTLFVDKNGERTPRLQGFRLAAFTRAWHAIPGYKSDVTVEDWVMTYDTYRGRGALDCLFAVLSDVWSEGVADGVWEEPTLEQVCDRVASLGGIAYEDVFGARVIEWDSGACEVRWGSGDAYTWVSLEEVLRAIPLPQNQVPAWWDDDWTDYEEIAWNGSQRFVKNRDLSTRDPRHPDYIEADDEEEAEAEENR